MVGFLDFAVVAGELWLVAFLALHCVYELHINTSSKTYEAEASETHTVKFSLIII